PSYRSAGAWPDRAVYSLCVVRSWVEPSVFAFTIVAGRPGARVATRCGVHAQARSGVGLAQAGAGWAARCVGGSGGRGACIAAAADGAARLAAVEVLIDFMLAGKMIIGVSRTISEPPRTIPVVIIVLRVPAGCAGEAGQTETKGDAAGDEQSGVVTREPIHLAEQLIDAFATQVVGKLDHALRHVGNVMRQARLILALEFRGSRLGALGDLLDLGGGRVAIAVQLLLALSLDLLGRLPGLVLGILRHVFEILAGGVRSGGRRRRAASGLAAVTCDFFVGCRHLIHLCMAWPQDQVCRNTAPYLGSVPVSSHSALLRQCRQARRGTQAMVTPLPSSATPHGDICRATLRAGPVFARCGVSRRLFGTPNIAPRALPRAKTGSGADAYETGTDPRQ